MGDSWSGQEKATPEAVAKHWGEFSRRPAVVGPPIKDDRTPEQIEADRRWQEAYAKNRSARLAREAELDAKVKTS
jgi:hypothetical protein